METMVEPKGQEKLEVAAEKPPISPKKRRRRVPTSGAAADCFACQELHRKCDRRRPYCTQCLDYGKDCSGYKTALTWNVGVASRGKLRGLSLPVADSKKVAQDPEAKSSKKRNSSSPKIASRSSRRDVQYPPISQLTAPIHDPGNISYSFVNTEIIPSTSPSSTSLPPPDIDWQSIPQLQDGMSRHGHKRVRRHPLKPIQIPALHTGGGLGVLPMSANGLSSCSEQDLRDSVQYPLSASSVAGFELYNESISCPSMVVSPFERTFSSGHEAAGWPRENADSSLSSDQSAGEYPDEDSFFADPIVANTLDDLLSAQQAHEYLLGCGRESLEVEEKARYLGDCQPTALVPDDCGAHFLSLPSSLSIGKTPSLQFLINHHNRVTSPVFVPSDGLSNPSQSHIPGRAVENDALRHAIAALSASNLRQRRAYHTSSLERRGDSNATSSHDQSARGSSTAHSILDVSYDQLSSNNPGVPSNGEIYHKAESIKALNEQFVDPGRRKDDSVPVTLLILCLYHICNMGAANFTVQFAAVKKILAIRSDGLEHNSKAISWLTTMFIWFDAMTAIVNETDGLLSCNDIDTSILDSDNWTLKNLAGCDGRLFKIIVNLGRLNLLSQNRVVREDSPRMTNARMGPLQGLAPRNQDFYSMNHNRFHRNEWPALSEDEADCRTQFWKEWSFIRKKLQDWNLSIAASTSTNYGSGQGDLADLSHIVESFRYSVLLYTEMLAYPHLPSTHPNIQTLVRKASYHIDKVESDAFLLWSLFITGAECISEQGRFLIRECCLDIQKDLGVFNNISCLEILEKRWQNNLIDELSDGFLTMNDEQRRTNNSGYGLKWRKAMKELDEEYILI